MRQDSDGFWWSDDGQWWADDEGEWRPLSELEAAMADETTNVDEPWSLSLIAFALGVLAGVALAVGICKDANCGACTVPQFEQIDELELS